MVRPIIFGDNYFTAHKNGYNHPENPKRISELLSMVRGKQLPLVSVDRDIAVAPEMIHQSSYISGLRERLAEARDIVELDEDTYGCRESFEVALAGLKLQQQAIDHLFSSPGSIPFTMSRPPGHHARPGSTMGFCLFNNVAYAARYAQSRYGVRKVAILDWDIHHFNGTEEIFYEDGDVLTISVHAYPHWPENYGAPEDRGAGPGEGFNLNLPMPIEAGDLQYLHYFENYFAPALARFQPELILVSAGFDAHHLERNSTTGSKNLMGMTEGGVSYLTHRLVEFAARNTEEKIQFVLEGGYYLPSLVSSAEAVIDTISTGKILYPDRFSTGERMNMEAYHEYQMRIVKALGE